MSKRSGFDTKRREVDTMNEWMDGWIDGWMDGWMT